MLGHLALVGSLTLVGHYVGSFRICLDHDNCFTQLKSCSNCKKIIIGAEAPGLKFFVLGGNSPQDECQSDTTQSPSELLHQHPALNTAPSQALDDVSPPEGQR